MLHFVFWLLFCELVLAFYVLFTTDADEELLLEICWYGGCLNNYTSNILLEGCGNLEVRKQGVHLWY